MDLEQQVGRNTADIAAVTVTVTRLAAVQEAAERQRAEDRELMRRAVDGLTALNEKMGVTIVLQENIKQLAEAHGELKGDLRAVRHDHANTKQTVGNMAALGEKIVENHNRTTALHVRADALEGRLNAVEAWRDKMDGAGGAFRLVGSALWAVFGTGILALGYFVFRAFFRGES